MIADLPDFVDPAALGRLAKPDGFPLRSALVSPAAGCLFIAQPQRQEARQQP
jgi:hypothetical protein